MTMNELLEDASEPIDAGHGDAPDAVGVPLPGGVTGRYPSNRTLAAEVDGDKSFGDLADDVSVNVVDQSHIDQDSDLLPDVVTEPAHQAKMIDTQPNGEHDKLTIMDEFEQPATSSPLEAATRVIPEDRWNADPRYAPSSSRDGEDAELSPGFIAIAPAFGERVVDGVVEACNLEDLVELHQEIANVLGDEHSHTAVLTEAPYPHNGTQGESDASRANNDAWLIAIRNGHWSLPGHYTRLNPFDHDEEPKFDTELTRDLHDTADKHIVFMLLAPREMQDQITEAADHGITELLDAVDHPEHHGGLVLPGERPDEADPLAFSWRGTSLREDINGMGVVDEISDEPSFMPVMEDLLLLDSPEARQEYVQHYAELAQMPRDELHISLNQAAADELGEEAQDSHKLYTWIRREESKTEQVRRQLRSIVAITNFNTRHREHRNMTDDEQAEARQAYAAGLVRVANKLRGDYVPLAA